MNNNRFFITGITGQVGSQLADFLLANTNYEIHGLMRWQEQLDNILQLSQKINTRDRVFLHNGDLNDFASLQRIFTNVKPKFVSHLAAQSYPKTSFDSPLETLQTNILGTGSLLEVLRKLVDEDIGYDPVVHICSSSEVYGKAKGKTVLSEESSFHGASPYSISKIGTDHLGQFYGQAYNVKTFVTRMGTHSGKRRSDVFFESTLAKQIALIEADLQEPIIKLGSLESIRTFQDTRDAIRAYYLLSLKARDGKIQPGECFNIAGEEAFKLSDVVDIMLSMSTRDDIMVIQDLERLRPIDADYQMFDNSKIKSTINWTPTIKARDMFFDLLTHWRDQISHGQIPLDR